MSDSPHTKFETIYEKIHGVTDVKLLLGEDGCYDDPAIQKAWRLFCLTNESSKSAIDFAIKKHLTMFFIPCHAQYLEYPTLHF